MYNTNSSPSIVNTVFSGNTAAMMVAESLTFLLLQALSTVPLAEM